MPVSGKKVVKDCIDEWVSSISYIYAVCCNVSEAVMHEVPVYGVWGACLCSQFEYDGHLCV